MRAAHRRSYRALIGVHHTFGRAGRREASGARAAGDLEAAVDVEAEEVGIACLKSG
jgi:hypothetical protein